MDPMSIEDATTLDVRYPSAEEIPGLWNLYLSHLHPMSKLFFDWDKGPLLQKAAESLQALSKAEQAFSFAVYFITILSLSREECEDVMSGSRQPQLLDDFQSSVETALLDAGYIATSDLLVLQAFLLYLVMLPRSCHNSIF